MMSRLLLLYFLFLLLSSQILSSSFSFSNSTKLCPHHQTLALLHLKQSFSINNSSSLDCHAVGVTSYPKTESWKKGSDCCSWDGVTCDWVTGHVIELDLSCSWLFGTIHSNTTLFLLPHIQRLNLAFNNFSGSSISVGFGRFSSLTHLNLSDSGFSGLISPEISHLSNLVSLDLSWNSDTEFARISISSVFPNSLLNRSSLISLHLSSCGLHGRFPDHDIHLPKLEVLNLWRNDDLSGNFPRFNENNSLTELYLSSKNFSGELPASIGNLKSLQTLDLSNCEFSGSIPASLENLTQITSLNLNGNHFSGKIPNIFNNLRNLISIGLSNNHFSGQFPPSIGNLTNLYYLDFSYNRLEGVIPFHVNEFYFQMIDLSMNELHGSIPSSIFKLVNLRSLYLSSNNLSGILETSNFGKLRNLINLYLSNNMLSLTTSGNSNCILPKIESIDLSNNKISGVWSWNMGKDTLWYLNLSYNSISGFEMLPWKNVGILDLHSNFGGISPLICKVSSIEFLIWQCYRNLDFNDNRLEGLVPRSLIICRKLEVLNLGNNKINDTFPHWLGTLPELQVLVLRSNSFHGHIGCSKLKSPFMSLRIIDLAHNDFEGDLPEMYLRSLKVTMNVDEDNMTRKYMGGNYYQDSVMVTIKGLEIEFVKILNAFATIDLSSNKFQGEIPQSIGNLNSLEGSIYLITTLQDTFHRNQFDTFGNDSYNGTRVVWISIVKEMHSDETPSLQKKKMQSLKINLIGNSCWWDMDVDWCMDCLLGVSFF
ncbi:hypothetical protein AAG906_006001 [Vitis piasezkii]